MARVKFGVMVRVREMVRVRDKVGGQIYGRVSERGSVMVGIKVERVGIRVRIRLRFKG